MIATVLAILVLTDSDDDYDDRRPQRRRYEEPLAATVRKQVLSIAENVYYFQAVSTLRELRG